MGVRADNQASGNYAWQTMVATWDMTKKAWKMLEPAERTVAQARFRPATAEEVAYAKGGSYWQGMTKVWNVSNKLLGTADLWWTRGQIKDATSPLPLRCAHNIKWLCRMAPERQFLRTYPTLRGTWTFIDSQIKVLEAFFAPNRDSDVFEHSRGFRAMLKIIQQSFPEEVIDPSDFMFTCSAEKNQQFHRLVLRLINGPHIKDNLPKIRSLVQETLAEWTQKSKAEGKVNISLESKIFASKIICHLMFGMTKRNDEVARAVNFLNAFVVKQVLTKPTAEEQEQFQKALKTFNDAVNEVLMSDQVIPLFADNGGAEMTLAQKKAMVFTIFFAGQETVGMVITHLMRLLALQSEMQHVLHRTVLQAKKEGQEPSKLQEINALFVRCMKECPPAFGVSRTVKVDTCLEFKFEGDEQVHKHIFYAGENVTGYMWNFAKAASPMENNVNAWKGFGSGAHHCPGEQLAKIEIMELVAETLDNYLVAGSSWNQDENPLVGYVTLQYRDDVWLNFTDRRDQPMATLQKP